MLKHVVSIKIKTEYSETEKKVAIQEIVEILKMLPKKIKQIKYYEVGVNINTKVNAMEIILISKFSNTSDLEIYRVHSEHLRALEIIKKHQEKIVFTDYKTEEFYYKK